MASFGSSSAPSFAGWIQHSVQGYEFASKYTSPAFDIYITKLHAYMSASVANATGFVCIWDGTSNALLASINIGTMGTGSNSAGGQTWRVGSFSAPGFFLAASTSVWLGGYSEGGIVFSTFDTNPGVWTVNTGHLTGPVAFSGGTFPGQGPCGSYAEYSQINSGLPKAMGGQGLLVVQSSIVRVTTGAIDLGGSGDLSVPNTNVNNPTTTRMGGSGGLSIPATNQKVPTIKIWRPA